MLPDAFPWVGLLALATAAFTDVTTDLLPAGLLPQLSSGLHVPEARAGLLVSAFAVASALAAIPVTAALRGLPRRPVLQAVLAGAALAGVLGWRAVFGLLAAVALLLVPWIGSQVPAIGGEPPARRAPLRQVASGPGVPVVLAVTLLLLTGRQAMYTYIAPFAPGRAGLVLLVFGVATALQTTVYNAGIAAGSLAGGVVLGRAGPADLPWVTLAFSAAALGMVAVARRAAFPAARPGSPALTQRNQHTRPLDEADTDTINTYCR